MPKYVRQSEEIYSKIFQVYGQLKAKNIPGIVRGGVSDTPCQKYSKTFQKKIFQKKYSSTSGLYLEYLR